LTEHIIKADLLMINKIDLASHVGTRLEVMERDTIQQRGSRPYVFTDLKRAQDCLLSWTGLNAASNSAPSSARL
jgi:Ni2+-binding GTPase involved in maturation of urease and hydrogenase